MEFVKRNQEALQDGEEVHQHHQGWEVYEPNRSGEERGEEEGTQEEQETETDCKYFLFLADISNAFHAALNTHKNHTPTHHQI